VQFIGPSVLPRPAVPLDSREVRQTLENDGYEEEQIQRRTDHWLFEAGCGRHANQGVVPQKVASATPPSTSGEPSTAAWTWLTQAAEGIGEGLALVNRFLGI
jgi:hypothetical protein